MADECNTNLFLGCRYPCLSITDLPEEILEYILSQLSPYQDLNAAKQVCKQWHRLVLGVTQMMQQNFRFSLRESKTTWTQILPESTGPTERYSHCACYFNKSMYVFGGCTLSNTTFNDLWRFDLASRQWIRPLAMGSYPSPKACASMTVYNESLVLFGGWSHPTPFPLHQADRFFNELHMYSPLPNRWTQLTSVSATVPDPVAGHSVSIVKDTMVVFGGSHVPAAGSNDLWVFEFVYSSWKLQPVTGPKPNMRYGQSQTTIDDDHILILGGCGGPNQIFNDIWLLTLGWQDWTWAEVKINNCDFAATQLWCHPVCKVGNTLVILNKSPKTSEIAAQASQQPVQSIRVLSAQQQAENRFHLAASQPSRSGENLPDPSKSTSRRNPTGPSQNTLRENLSGSLRNRLQENLMDLNSELGESVPSSSRNMLQEMPMGSPGSRLEENQLDSSRNPVSPSINRSEGLPGPSVRTSQESATLFQRKISPSEFSTARTSVDMDVSFSTDVSCDDNVRSQTEMTRSHRDAESIMCSVRKSVHGSAEDGVTSPSHIQHRSASESDSSSPNHRGGTLNLRPGHPSVKPNSMHDRQKQLDLLRKYEQRIRQHVIPPSVIGIRPNLHCGNVVRGPRIPMCLYLLDIGTVTQTQTSTWLCPRETFVCNSPDDRSITIFYSLVEGRSELILFGGIQMDLSSTQRRMDISTKSHLVSNNLYVLHACKPNL